MKKLDSLAKATTICNESELSVGSLKSAGAPAIIVALGLFVLCCKYAFPDKPVTG